MAPFDLESCSTSKRYGSNVGQRYWIFVGPCIWIKDNLLHDNFVKWLIFPFSSLDKMIQLINVILVMLSMMVFEAFFRNNTLESVLWEWKLWEFVHILVLNKYIQTKKYLYLKIEIKRRNDNAKLHSSGWCKSNDKIVFLCLLEFSCLNDIRWKPKIHIKWFSFSESHF